MISRNPMNNPLDQPLSLIPAAVILALALAAVFGLD